MPRVRPHCLSFVHQVFSSFSQPLSNSFSVAKRIYSAVNLTKLGMIYSQVNVSRVSLMLGMYIFIHFLARSQVCLLHLKMCHDPQHLECALCAIGLC